MKPRAIYILPGLGLGGVETALGASYSQLSKEMDIQVVTLDKDVSNVQGIPAKQMGVSTFLWIYRQKKGALIITSLWRAHLFGVGFRLLGFKWIAFFHNAMQGHLLNRTVCRLSARLASLCFFDSQHTKVGFEHGLNRDLGPVIPFLLRRSLILQDSLQPVIRDIDMIFAGRFIALKRLDLCIALAKLCIGWDRNFKIAIVGEGRLKEEVASFCDLYPQNAQYCGRLDNSSVRALMRRSKMIVCLSDYEGMAMSVVEGIQEGCVPVVRLTGEIGSYVGSESGIICEEDLDLKAVLGQIQIVCMNREMSLAMNERAKKNLTAYPDYAETFMSHIEAFYERAFASDVGSKN